MDENRNNLYQTEVEWKEKEECKIYACWLDTIYWLAGGAKYRLLEAAGTARDVYLMSERHIASVVGEKACERLMQHKRQYHPQKVWNYVKGNGISYTYCREADFPQKLADIPDPPFGIFYKGKLPEENVPAVAVIGSRKCSEYGKYMAEMFAAGFAAAGVDVISGMAHGIDGISQRVALKAGGSSFAVLGCGVDVVYPKANEPLYRQLQKKGGVLSEYPPRMEPRPALFPPRNRIISAFADVVVVVEAREKSGTLITVDMALEQGKEVYALPGRCTDVLSMGCNRLLRQGALIAVSPDDIISDMHWEHQTDRSGSADNGLMDKKISETAKEIYVVLDSIPVTQEEIVARLRKNRCTLTVPQICQGLVELEIKGVAASQNRLYKLLPAKTN
ncbi:MAG: DNA-processing protein DprA [Lachnospiraceae bacterium]|nr:DNA-processing protein DprA [Lachnospiraceae bacterium]